jgi:nicotinate phosphoribosyltransferase
MTPLSQIFRPSLALLTDLYQLTMACGYFRTGMADREASFSLFFRKTPFGGGYVIASGLADVIDTLDHFRFADEDLTYLAGLRGSDRQPLFGRDFLDYLRGLRLSCDVLAVPEGTVVFAHEPLLRVTGPLLQVQLLETVLLTLTGFASLVATKASRVCAAASGRPVLEFGLRRAQGIMGGLSASRAAYIGGCAATSNVLAGRLYGIPVRGTHAHSWVMAFESELEAFLAYASAMPNNCLFLVDTYDTIAGVRHAIEVGQQLRQHGQDLVGIRLDSGDLGELSQQARQLLNQAGFEHALIVASDDLDEHRITELEAGDAVIDVWGVGTQLSTAFDQPALGQVFKLTAIREAGGSWEYRVKLSDTPGKSSQPGLLQVRRYRGAQGFVGDVIYDAPVPPASRTRIVDPVVPTRQQVIGDATEHEDLLVSVMRSGQSVYDLPTLDDIRARMGRQLAGFSREVVGLTPTQSYPVGLEPSLAELKSHLIREARRT